MYATYSSCWGVRMRPVHLRRMTEGVVMSMHSPPFADTKCASADGFCARQGQRPPEDDETLDPQTRPSWNHWAQIHSISDAELGTSCKTIIMRSSGSTIVRRRSFT